MAHPASVLPASAPAHAVRVAHVTRVLPGTHVELRAGSTPRRATLAVPGYRASVGDRVVWAESDAGDALVLGVLSASAPAAVVASDGASASLEDGALVVRSPGGAPLVRYEPSSGALRVEASEGDLVLAAPSGSVVLAARDELALTAGHRAHVTAPAVAVTARETTLRTDEASARIERLTTTVGETLHRVGKLCVEAGQIVERAVDTVREVEGLAETRAGRARLLVDGLSQLFARRTAIVSDEDTSVDGKRVLLG